VAPFVPEFEGELTLDPLPEDFATRIQRRVEGGLLTPGRLDRADYQVTAKDRSGITFVARGFLTRYNIGLNEVTVGRGGGNRLRYRVSYWGWTRIAVAHGLLLGAAMAGAWALLPGMRREMAQYPFGAWIFWGNVALWCVAWPWLLSALHKPHAEGALKRILCETLASPPSGGAAASDARRAS
jgi:hypothetical protein